MKGEPLSPPKSKAMTSGLSGNELYCLHLKGLAPGNLVIGNSVFSMGFFGGIASGFNSLLGGEVTQITEMIREGRHNSYQRLVTEAARHGGVGMTGITSDLVMHQGNVEFLSIGSCVHREAPGTELLEFSTSSDGQELYCQLDCGFKPRKFVFGNVAYSIGVGGGLTGAFRSLTRGEVTEYTEIFSRTRHLALERITEEAEKAGANAVIGIETTILPFMGVQEMIMIGTAAHHPLLTAYDRHPITSDMTNQEMWNAIHLGYMPVRLVMGVSVYSLGVVGGLMSAFQSLSRGEVSTMTELIYEAREKAIARIHDEAALYNADTVLGIKTYVYQLGGGLIEFLAIGTAVRKVEGLTTQSPILPAQAIIIDRDTFVNSVEGGGTVELNTRSGRMPQLLRQKPTLVVVLVAMIYLLVIWVTTHGRG